MSSEAEALQSECDHIIAIEEYTDDVLHLSEAKRTSDLLKCCQYDRYHKCPLCGTNLAPIFKALESSE